MKFRKAIKMGKACGLKTPEESVNNVLIHVTNFFAYRNIDKEVRELVEEAKRKGMKFHDCGMALIDGECYMCERGD